MKRISLKTILRMGAALVTISSIYLFAPWEFGLYYLKPIPKTIEQELSSAVSEGLDGIIVYVVQKDKDPEYYAEGFHNRDEKIKAYPQALFKIASIAKLYDASAAVKLAASGQLSLDHTLAFYLPELSRRIQNSDKITLRMMIQHRSGIPNFTDNENFNWGESSLNMLELILDQPADFEPNSNYRYSNSNYYLLQRIMTKVLGYDYGRFIKEEMLVPLGITDTYMSVNEVDQSKLMSGYYVGYSEDFKHLDQGMVATAEDVGQFLGALNKGSLFTRKEAEIYKGLYEFQHDGWVLGYWSRARYYQDIDTIVIQFVNTTGDDTLLLSQIIHDRIVDIIRRRQPPTI
jgi:CubicO group peptidase (beta-lactamase class C family)